MSTGYWFLLGGLGTATADPVAPTVSIDQGATITLLLGATRQLSATVTGEPEPTLSWESSDAAVATVDAAGLVTGVGAGAATITARGLNEAGEATDTITAEVSALPPVPSLTATAPRRTFHATARR